MNTTPAQRIGQLIRHHRHQAGVTQRQIAAELGVAQATVSAWEAGTYEPSVVTLAQLSHHLGVPTDAWIAAVKEGDAA